MARPKTKSELLDAAAARFDALMSLIGAMSEVELTTDFDFSTQASRTEAHWQRDKNLRDVLTHLHEWHVLFVTWVGGNLNGSATRFLPSPYTWKTYGNLNEVFFQKHQETTLQDAKLLLRTSHTNCLEAIRRFSNDELFTKKHYNWTGSTSVGSYAVSATSSHYDWAIKKLKAHRKNLANN